MKNEKDIKRILKEGKYLNKKYFIIYIKKTTKKSEIIKIRFIVTKKIGTAVERNRIKRLLKETLRIFNDKDCYEFEIIVIAKKGIGRLSFWDINKEMNKILKQVL
ncbi:ribonuclease P protein component [bacterium]|nr:ribonuclease P protein component [bacterium]